MSKLATVNVFGKWVMVCLSYNLKTQIQLIKNIATKVGGVVKIEDKYIQGLYHLDFFFEDECKAMRCKEALLALFKDLKEDF